MKSHSFCMDGLRIINGNFMVVLVVNELGLTTASLNFTYFERVFVLVSLVCLICEQLVVCHLGKAIIV